MSLFDFDVIVAGAGPAGSSAAKALADQGVRVAVFDRDAFPRDKPCAGAVSEQCLHWLGDELPASLIRREFFGGLLCFEDVRIDVQHDYRAGVLVRRRDFDAYLLEMAERAGAEVHTAEPVLEAGEISGGVAVRSDAGRYTARYLVVAEGAAGRLKRLVRPVDRKEEVMFCLCADVAPDEQTSALSTEASLVLHFGLCTQGYGWIFSQPGKVNVGIGENMACRVDPRKRLQAFLAEHHVPMSAVSGGNVIGHKIPLGGFRRPVAKGRILLAGDAGGFTDAVLGEGIGYAVRSGQIAGACVGDSLRKGGDAGTAVRYTRVVEREMGRDLRHSLILSRALRLMPRPLMRAVLTDRKALSRYVDILAGRVGYPRFNCWMALRLPYYAARALAGKILGT
jgi:geranylgeranyl reductase family protein